MYLLLDTNALVHALFHISEPKDSPNVVERLLNRLEHIQTWTEQQANQIGEPAHLLAIFDPSGPSFRSVALPSYKANRTPTEPELDECIAHAKEAISNSDDWTVLIAPYWMEADDLIASIACQVDEKVIIHSADKDFMQCLSSGRVGICKRSGVNSTPKENGSGGVLFGTRLEVTSYTERDLVKEYAFAADRWVDYQCLVGDSADNVKGCRGIGRMTAQKIICTAPRLEDYDPKILLDRRQRDGWKDFLERLPLLRNILTLRTNVWTRSRTNG